MFFIFLALWFILNARLTFEALWLGILISAVMTLFCVKFMGYDYKKDKERIRLIPRALHYFFTLIVEIVKANLSVIHMILSDTEVVQPQLVSFETELKNESSRVVLANSITLTPGTITASLKDGTFVVHCLDSDYMWDLDKSVFVEELKEMEEKSR